MIAVPVTLAEDDGLDSVQPGPVATEAPPSSPAERRLAVDPVLDAPPRPRLGDRAQAEPSSGKVEPAGGAWARKWALRAAAFGTCLALAALAGLGAAPAGGASSSAPAAARAQVQRPAT
ncbi:MAG: hypothetical protein ACYCZV_12065, partial [Acidimicrobiales bacterium]